MMEIVMSGLFRKAFSAAVILAALLLPAVSQAADLSMSAMTVTKSAGGSEEYSISVQVLILMTMLTFLPSIIIMMTSRIIVVLGILRQAIGLQQSPSNQILVGIALFLTFFIMSPVLDEMNTTALQPYLNDQITSKEAFEKAQEPLRKFMLQQTRVKDLNSFMEYAGEKADTPEQVPLKVLIPAFMVSELKTAFQMGFMLFLPFLVIDLVTASILMAMGMMMLSPALISLPFKLMLFVLVDGWSLLIGTLVSSFGIGTGG